MKSLAAESRRLRSEGEKRGRWGDRRGKKGGARRREEVRKLQRRGSTCYRSSGFTNATLFLFPSIAPELLHALSRFLSPFAISRLLARIIHKLLTSERLKDRALFEVDSKEVIPGQDLAGNLPQKNSTKERWNTLLSPEERRSSSFLSRKLSVFELAWSPVSCTSRLKYSTGLADRGPRVWYVEQICAIFFSSSFFYELLKFQVSIK